MIIFIDIHMTYLIFSNISEDFFKPFLIMFVMNFAFIDIFHINNESSDVDKVNTINGMFLLTIMA